LPDFENGAFEILGSTARSKWLVDEGFLDAFVPDGNVMRHTMRGLIRSIRVVDNNSKEFHCDLVNNLLLLLFYLGQEMWWKRIGMLID